jgi:hypothetical protein
MASLVYDLPLTEFDARPFERLATYGTRGSFGQLTISLTEDEMLAEFGTVPRSIRVTVRVTEDTPADAWLDASDANPGHSRTTGTDALAAAGETAILRQAVTVLQRRDWPGQAMLAGLIQELSPPGETAAGSTEQET